MNGSRTDRWFLAPLAKAIRLNVTRQNMLGSTRRAHTEIAPDAAHLNRKAWRARFLRVR